MNHRCGERHRLAATMLLRRPGWGGCFVGRLVDLSVSGAFVATRVWAFPVGSVVRLETAATIDGVARLLRCQAMVVRASRTGIGLMFDEIGPPGFTALLASGARVTMS